MKVLGVLLTALTGAIGTLIGLIAIWRRWKVRESLRADGEAVTVAIRSFPVTEVKTPEK